jgi:molybdate-binding protein
VEELFILAEPEAESTRAIPLPGGGGMQAGSAVQLCAVDKRLIALPPAPLTWWLPVSDGVIADRSGRVRFYGNAADYANRVLLAGCDPAGAVLARHARAAGAELIVTHRNSAQAIDLLKAGFVHIAGTHLDGARPLDRKTFAAISFARWEEGIITAAGNPKSIRGASDLARPRVRFVNREEGSGCRALLDAELGRLRIPTRAVKGYSAFASGHLHAAWLVHSGAADCCIATRAAANVFGLHFIPLAERRYDLAVRRKHLDLAPVRNLLDMLNRSPLRRELEGSGGYDMSVAGALS